MDLSELVASNRVVALLDLVDQLPAASRLNEAIASDPEQAEAIARRVLDEDDDDEAHPSQAEWTPLHEAVATLIDITVAANAGKDDKPWSYPRPRSLVAEARDRIVSESRDDFLSELM